MSCVSTECLYKESLHFIQTDCIRHITNVFQRDSCHALLLRNFGWFSPSHLYLLLFRMQPVAAGFVIDGSTAVPLMQSPLLLVSWCSFCRPQKDDRLSQPTWCYVNGRQGLDLAVKLATLTVKPTPACQSTLISPNVLSQMFLMYNFLPEPSVL